MLCAGRRHHSKVPEIYVLAIYEIRRQQRAWTFQEAEQALKEEARRMTERPAHMAPGADRHRGAL